MLCIKHILIIHPSTPFVNTKDTFCNLLDTVCFFSVVDSDPVLPYHNMGKYKWKKLGLKYELENVRAANDEDIKKTKKILGIS